MHPSQQQDSSNVGGQSAETYDLLQSTRTVADLGIVVGLALASVLSSKSRIRVRQITTELL